MTHGISLLNSCVHHGILRSCETQIAERRCGEAYTKPFADAIRPCCADVGGVVQSNLGGDCIGSLESRQG